MANGVRNRERADQISTQGLAQLLEAHRELRLISEQSPDDGRGYNSIAGLHGFPLDLYCQHRNLLFLPWHRAYLYYLELALTDIVPGAAIPWWDWIRRPNHDAGLPSIFTDAQINGQANPLFDAPILLDQRYYDWLRESLPGTLSDHDPPRTVRDPGPIEELPTEQSIDDILRAPTFADFSGRLESMPHNQIHSWVGGGMSVTLTAAFDPIFWSHHAMIDRLWYLWQISEFGEDPPASQLNVILLPFNMTVRDTLNINDLKYEYTVTVVA